MLVEHTDTVNNGPKKKKVFSPLFAASSQNTLLWASREYQTALLYRWISFWVGQNEAVLRENTYLEVLSLTCKICQIPWWHHKGSDNKLCLKERIFFFSSQFVRPSSTNPALSTKFSLNKKCFLIDLQNVWDFQFATPQKNCAAEAKLLRVFLKHGGWEIKTRKPCQCAEWERSSLTCLNKNRQLGH